MPSYIVSLFEVVVEVLVAGIIHGLKRTERVVDRKVHRGTRGMPVKLP
jgi:hypothetical protein